MGRFPLALLAALLLPAAAGAAEALPDAPPPPPPDSAPLPPPPPPPAGHEPADRYRLPPPPEPHAGAPTRDADPTSPPAAAAAPVAEVEQPRERPSPPPFSPDATTFGVYVRNATTWVSDPAFDLVGEDDTLNRMEVGLELNPGWLGGALLFEAGYAGGASTARVFQTFDATLTLQSVQLGAVYRQPVGRFSRPYVRVMPSLDWAHLSLEDEVTTELDDIALTFGVEAVLGWELLLGVGGETEDGRPEAHLSASAELGYALHPMDARFDELSRDVTTGDSETTRVDLVEIDGGGLDLSGLVLRFGLAYRF